ncbi:MAG: type II toxin-antitoxin system HicB family antitoxin [Desulfovibrio sp.]|nr:type II toxin-antitoxin system HicB family antitoxin [Desulfovibrio sp.]
MGNYYVAGIVEEQNGSGYSVYFPDFMEVCAGGGTIPEAIANATEGLFLAVRNRIEDNRDIPEPCDLDTAKEKIKAERKEDSLETPNIFLQYIPAPEASKMPVRISVTIPCMTLEKIDERAREAGMTRSGYLAAAALAANL